MAEAHGIFQVAMDRKGGIPEDVVVNTWHFQSEGGGIGDSAGDLFDVNVDGVLDRLEAFYDELATMWSGALAGTATIKGYLFEDDVPRVPRATRTTTFGTLADAMPSEVALCLSMAATIASGDRAGRRRGRVYLGPFGRNLTTYTSPQPDGRPASTQLNTILDAAVTLSTGASPEGFKLAVFSPTEKLTGGSTTEAWNVVHKLWVDNAWDIQRRRGARASLREERTV